MVCYFDFCFDFGFLDDEKLNCVLLFCCSSKRKR